MPWPPEQRKAIAASLARRGKSQEEIREFFHRHGHPHKKRKRRRRGTPDRINYALRKKR